MNFEESTSEFDAVNLRKLLI